MASKESAEARMDQAQKSRDLATRELENAVQELADAEKAIQTHSMSL